MPPHTIDLTPPLRIDALRLEHVTAHLHDRAVTPVVDAQFDLDVRVSDLGLANRPARLWIEASSSPLLDVVRVEGEATDANEVLDANVRVLVSGLHPKPVAGYLAAYGVRPVADGIAFSTRARLHVTPAPGATGSIAAKVNIDDLTASADAAAVAAIDHIVVDAPALGPSRAHLTQVELSGVRVNADRGPSGALRIVGLELMAAAPRQVQPAARPVSVRSAAPATPFSVNLANLKLGGFKLSFHDSAVSPPANLALEIPELSIKDFDSDAARARDATIAATILCPGILRSVRISGTGKVLADRQAVALSVAADGLNPEALAAYLKPLGLASEYHDGQLTCQLDAGLSVGNDGALLADASVHGVRLADGPELLHLDQISLKGLGINSSFTSASIEDLQIVGPTVPAARDPAGAMHALGLSFNPGSPASRPPSGAAQPTAVSVNRPAFVLPKLYVHHFGWKGIRLQLDDRAVSPPAVLALSDAGVEVSDLLIDPAGTSRQGSPGKLHAWLASPQLAKDIQLDGTISPMPSGLSTDLQLAATGIRSVALAPYVTSFGVAPVMQNGAIHLKARIDLAAAGQGFAGGLTVRDFQLSDGDANLVTLGSVGISGLNLQPGKIAIEAIDIEKPRALVARDEMGAFLAAGLRTFANQPQAPAAVVPATNPVPAAAAPLPVIALKKLTVHDAALQWSDRGVTPVAGTTAGADVEIDDFVFGPNSAPGNLKLRARSEGLLDDLSVAGTLSAGPSAAAARLSVSASGIHEGMLVSYLPPGVRVNLRNGQFHTLIDASTSANPQGGQAARLAISDLEYSDAAGGPPLLKFDSARVVAGRIDPPGRVCAIDEVSLTGLETTITKQLDGEAKLLGLTFGAAPNAPPAAAPTTRRAAPLPTTAPAADALQLVAARRKALPLVTLDKLAVQIRRIALMDQSRPAAESLALTDVNLANRARIELLGSEPTARPPVALQLSGGVSPAVGAFTGAIDVTPFAPRPALRLDLSASGITGDGLTRLYPQLKPQIDGKGLTDGRFHARVEAQASIFRPSPAEFDLSEPFDVEFLVKGVEFRDGADGPLLAGLDEIRSEAIHVDPKAALVSVRSIDITKPQATAYRDRDGVHVMGLVIKPVQTAAVPSASTPPVRTPAPVAMPAPAPATPGSGEIRVARLLVNGLDLRIEDRAVEPQVLIPLNGLDIDVRDLSSRAFVENRPFRFSVLLNAGKVPLPQRSTTGAFTGAMRDVRALAAGKQVATAPAMEQRDLFSQFEAAGVMSLYPQPNGWVKSSVSSLELGEFKGEARDYGVELDDGTFDASADVRFVGDGSMQTRLRPSFTDLRVSEPANGPIVRFLHLPAPLNVAIAALQDADGSITAPLNVPIRQGHLNTGDVINAAVGAASAIIITAIASAPAKAAEGVTGTVTDVVGAFIPFDIFGRKKEPEKPTVITFAPGDAAIDAPQHVALSVLVERLQRDPNLEVTLRHELSSADLPLEAARANPSRDDALRLAGRLRLRRGELLSLRAQMSGQARVALFSMSSDQQALAVQRLRGVDRELASTEDALDRLYELLRPGADSQRDRRTRQACLEVGWSRLHAVGGSFAAAGIPESRVRLARPQFAPAASPPGGDVTITVVKKK